jgi:pimeloyl-ACP methyl ester carboxylesterase
MATPIRAVAARRRGKRALVPLGLQVTGVLLLAGVVAYLGVGAYIASQMSRPMRQPLRGTPANQGLVYEDVTFSSVDDNIPLQGWLIDSPGDKTIILVHATDGNRDDPTIGLPLVTAGLARHNYDVLAFDLRAHGQSGGSHFTLGQLETRDVAGAIRFLQSRGRTSIGALGWSLGAATLCNSYPDQPALQAVVADSAFASLPDVLHEALPRRTHLPVFFHPGIYLMGRALYGGDVGSNQPERVLARLGTRPLLLIHGQDDSDVPVAHAYRLQQAGAGNPQLQFWVAPGASHARAFQRYPDEYLERVTAFFDAYLP